MGWKVGLAAVVIAALLMVILGVPGTGHGGFKEGVQQSAECKGNPDGMWCKLWGAK